jgi:hypothetical protein
MEDVQLRYTIHGKLTFHVGHFDEEGVLELCCRGICLDEIALSLFNLLW